MNIPKIQDSKGMRAIQGVACNSLGVQYENGQGVRQNRSIAKQYFGKACDLGDQLGCNNYKEYNEKWGQ